MVAEGGNHPLGVAAPPSISRGRKKRMGSGAPTTSKQKSSSGHTSAYIANNNNGENDEEGLLVDFRRRNSGGNSSDEGDGEGNSSSLQPSATTALITTTTSLEPNENVNNSKGESSDNAITRGREKSKGLLARAGKSLRSLSRSRSSRGGGDNNSGREYNNNSSGSGGGIASRIDLFKRSSSSNSSSIPLGDTDSLSSNYSNSSSSSAALDNNSSSSSMPVEMIITVTSCRSDAYHDQRAPGSTTKLPRRAPSALKTFHELAVGVKDAYEAGGCTPRLPPSASGMDGTSITAGDGAEDVTNSGGGGEQMNANDTTSNNQQDVETMEGQRILFDFFGNLDFLLALVEEVAIDTATRGALKEDTTFRGLRDVIKKCNKVLELMLVRRERKYTLMFRIVGPRDVKMLKKISHWNARVEKALGNVTQDGDGDSTSLLRNRAMSDDTGSDVGSVSSMSSTSSRSSQVISAVVRRGRELLPTAGKVRARRATPTPRLRLRRSRSSDDSAAGEDGYSSDTVPMTTENLAKLQLSLDNSGNSTSKPGLLPQSVTQIHGDKKKKSAVVTGAVAGQVVKPMSPKEE